MEKHTKIGNLNTANDILKSKETYDEEYPTVSISDATEAMIEFAKLHVQAALVSAWQKAKIKQEIEYKDRIKQNELKLLKQLSEKYKDINH